MQFCQATGTFSIALATCVANLAGVPFVYLVHYRRASCAVHGWLARKT